MNQLSCVWLTLWLLDNPDIKLFSMSDCHVLTVCLCLICRCCGIGRFASPSSKSPKDRCVVVGMCPASVSSNAHGWFPPWLVVLMYTASSEARPPQSACQLEGLQISGVWRTVQVIKPANRSGFITFHSCHVSRSFCRKRRGALSLPSTVIISHLKQLLSCCDCERSACLVMVILGASSIVEYRQPFFTYMVLRSAVAAAAVAAQLPHAVHCAILAASVRV